MLEMRPACEKCSVALPPGDEGAFICSYECTFCERCAGDMTHACPNCGGALRPRPTRAT